MIFSDKCLWPKNALHGNKGNNKGDSHTEVISTSDEKPPFVKRREKKLFKFFGLRGIFNLDIFLLLYFFPS